LGKTGTVKKELSMVLLEANGGRGSGVTGGGESLRLADTVVDPLEGKMSAESAPPVPPVEGDASEKPVDYDDYSGCVEGTTAATLGC
jgi:hypothetical protein